MEQTVVKFLHTADWQLGKPFARIPDADKRHRLQQARLDCLERLAAIARRADARFILVAGDLFDSPSPARSLVSATFQAIGAMRLPVVAIPGNHDFGGPGGPWEQAFVQQEMAALAPNFSILTEERPLVLDEAVILPAPLHQRHVAHDPTAWIRQTCDALPDDRPRIVLAHGSVHGFGSADEEEGATTYNRLDLSRLPDDQIDYIALGDWHGLKSIDPKTWYSGTPEIDGFPKGEGHRPGHALLVEVARGVAPQVEVVATGSIRWERIGFRFDAESSLAQLERLFDDRLGSGAEGALLHLDLSGRLTLSERLALDQRLETWEARLIWLRVDDQVREAPSGDEIERLTQRAEDPLTARVARRLLAETESLDAEVAAIARLALRELYQAANA
nr:DNA repair exonuclease [Allochromatium humboldtianum]